MLVSFLCIPSFGGKLMINLSISFTKQLCVTASGLEIQQVIQCAYCVYVSIYVCICACVLCIMCACACVYVHTCLCMHVI